MTAAAPPRRARSRPATRAPLREREHELAALADALAAARAGSGRLLVIEGHAGLGKSRLLEAGVEMAGESGMTVARAAGGPLEREFPFGIVLQLIEPHLAALDDDRRDELLSGAASLCRPLFESASHEPPAGDERLFPLLHGLYWISATLAERSPALIALDDAHWADRPSLRFLCYLAQRLADLPIAVVLTLRRGERGPEAGLLAEIARHPLARRLWPAPLSRAGVDELVGSRFPGAEDEFGAACADLTAGNPLLLGELLDQARADGLAADAAGAARVGRLSCESLSHALLARLARMPEPGAEVARAVAVLGSQAQLRYVAALAGTDQPTAAAAADALVAADFLRAGEPLGFAHPLVRSSLYADMPPARRARAHLEAARLLAADAAPVEAMAGHLLEAERAGNGWVVATLRDAAARATGRGAPDSAARYLRRALAEPPPAGARAAVLLELGQAEAAIGAAEAAERLAEAVSAASCEGQRAAGLLALGRSRYQAGDFAAAAEAFEGALAAGDADGEPCVPLEVEYALTSLLEPSLRPGAFVRVERLLARGGDFDRALLALLAVRKGLAGEDCATAAALARRAWGDGALLADGTGEAPSVYAAASVLTWCGDEEAARWILDAALEDARRRGSLTALATAYRGRASLEFTSGRVAEAVADAERAVSAASDAGGAWVSAAHGMLAVALLEQGDADAAARALAVPPDVEARWLGRSPVHIRYREARARLRMAQGQPAAAHEDWRACGRLAAALGTDSPALAPWRSGAALSLARLGQREEAGRLAVEELALARRWGAPGPIGAALTALGVVENGHGLPRLIEAVGSLEAGTARLAHARAVLELGAALRRQGSLVSARETLRHALELAEACGAGGLAGRARTEVRSAGGRLRRSRLTGPDALTAGERRVAELAAAGRTNREIAEELFVTVKAVEFHLRHAYAKLGIGSRKELPGAFAAGTAES